jgi:hypothetical protein
MSKNKADLYRKLVAVLLAVGGAAGVVVCLWNEEMMLSHAGSGRSVNAALMGLFAFVFGASAWVGVDLWRKRTHAFLWAQVLLVAQIPTISFPGFACHFYTGMTLYLLLNQTATTTLGFQANFGSEISFQISSQIEGFIFGINLIAVVALYLLGKARVEGGNSKALKPGPL